MNWTEKQKMENIITKEAKLAQLEKDIERNKKRMKQIESSKTWHYSKLLRNVSSPQNEEEDRERLLEEMKNELINTREKVKELQLHDRNLNSTRIAKLVRKAKDDAELIPLLNRVLDEKQQQETNYEETLSFIARHFQHATQDEQNFIYARVLEGMKIEDIPEFIVRAGLTETDPISLEQAASFRASLSMRMRQKQLGSNLPEWLLDDKQAAYQFVDHLGIKRPWVSDETYTVSSLPKQEKKVIKPVDAAGSRGVYLIYSIHDIVDIKNQRTLTRWDDLLESMKQDLQTGDVEADEWLMEELILENEQAQTPASDIKFYCFYGKVGLILEITRFPELMYAWWTDDGELVRTGKYATDLYKGNGVTEAEIKLAEKVSQDIPAPFIRIDFLRSEHGLVFGEFTPKPGNYDEFTDEVDRWLGDLYLQAEARLRQDLWEGKAFTTFKQFEVRLKQDGNI